MIKYFDISEIFTTFVLSIRKLIMRIRKSKKTGRLIIDGQGSTLVLEPGQSLNLQNLKRFKITNLKIRRKQSPLLRFNQCNLGEINYLDIKDSEI